MPNFMAYMADLFDDLCLDFDHPVRFVVYYARDTVDEEDRLLDLLGQIIGDMARPVFNMIDNPARSVFF